ncbi:hypothetical protein ACLB1Q_08740 [Escherichia coli]
MTYQNAFLLANVFYVRRCRGAGATGKSQHLAAAASGQSSGSAKTNFMWWKMTVVLSSHRQKYNVGFLALLQANPR